MLLLLPSHRGPGGRRYWVTVVGGEPENSSFRSGLWNRYRLLAQLPPLGIIYETIFWRTSTKTKTRIIVGFQSDFQIIRVCGFLLCKTIRFGHRRWSTSSEVKHNERHPVLIDQLWLSGVIRWVVFWDANQNLDLHIWQLTFCCRYMLIRWYEIRRGCLIPLPNYHLT